MLPGEITPGHEQALDVNDDASLNSLAPVQYQGEGRNEYSQRRWLRYACSIPRLDILPPQNVVSRINDAVAVTVCPSIRGCGSSKLVLPSCMIGRVYRSAVI